LYPLADGKPLTHCRPDNSGVILFKKNERNDVLFRKWGEIFAGKLERNEFRKAGEGDQNALAEAMLQSDAKIYALPNIFNARTPFPLLLLGSAMIIHGRHKDVGAIRTRINRVTTLRLWDPRQADVVPLERAAVYDDPRHAQDWHQLPPK
jgi:hypothetical protein